MARIGKRREIVEAAVGLMAVGGPEALTASALAAAAGVSKANLFHHFESLDDVVLAAFEAFILGMANVRAPSAATLAEWLTALMAEATESVSAAPRLGAAYLGFVVRARSEPRLRARLVEVIAEIQAAFAAIIAGFRPELEEHELKALAELVLIAGDGLVIHRDLFPERAASQEAAWRTFVVLVAGKEADR